jgi:hypothetical protein
MPIDQANSVLPLLVRAVHEAELRERVDAAVDRQLAVFLAMQSVPSRPVLLAA